MCAAPNQAERQKCWSARDEFWKCLEENEKEPLKCIGERTKFEGSCSKTWVSAFSFDQKPIKNIVFQNSEEKRLKMVVSEV